MLVRKKGNRWLDYIVSDTIRRIQSVEDVFLERIKESAEKPLYYTAFIIPYTLCHAEKGKAAIDIYRALLGEQYAEYSGVTAKLASICKTIHEESPDNVIEELRSLLGDDMDTVLASAELLIRVLHRTMRGREEAEAAIRAARAYSLLENRVLPYVYVDESLLREYLLISRLLGERGAVVNDVITRIVNTASKLLIRGYTVAFTGPNGVGKHVLSYLVAKNLMSHGIRVAVSKKLNRGRRGVLQIVPLIDKLNSHYRLWKFFFTQPEETLLVIDPDTYKWLVVNGFISESNIQLVNYKRMVSQSETRFTKSFIVIEISPEIYSEETLRKIHEKWCGSPSLADGSTLPLDIVLECLIDGENDPYNMLRERYMKLGEPGRHAIHVALAARTKTVHASAIAGAKPPEPLIDIHDKVYGFPSVSMPMFYKEFVDEERLSEADMVVSRLAEDIIERDTYHGLGEWVSRAYPRTTLRQIYAAIENGIINNTVLALFDNILRFNGILSLRQIDIVDRLEENRSSTGPGFLEILRLALDEIDIRRRLREDQWMLKRRLARTLNSLGVVYMRLGYLQEASEPLAEAMSIMEELVYARKMYILENELARIYNNLGTLYLHLNRINDALELLEKSVVIRRKIVYEKKLGEHSLELARTLNNYALALHNARRYEEAMKAYKEALGLLEKIAMESKDKRILLEYAKTLVNAAHTLRETGDYQGALEKYKLAHSIYGESNALTPDTEIMLLTNMAELYTLIGDYDKAINKYRELINTLRIEIKRGRSELYTSIYRALYSLALVYYKSHRIREAEDILRELADTLEKHVDREASDELYEILGMTYNSLATIMREKGDIEEALKLYEKAYRIRSMLVYGRGVSRASIGLARTISNMASIYYDLGDVERAEKLYREAARLLENILSINPSREALIEYAHVLHNMGLVLSDLGRYREALEALSKAEEIRRRLVYQEGLDELLPELATTLNNEALILLDLGQYEKALELFREAQGIRELLYNREKSLQRAGELASTLNNIAIALIHLARYDEALEILDKAETILRELVEKKPTPSNYNQLANTLNNKAFILSKKGAHQEALRLYEEAERIRRELVEKYGGREYTRYLANTISSKASLLARLGRIDDALRAYSEAEQLLDRILKEREHPEDLAQLARIRSSIAALLFKQGRYREAAEKYAAAVDIWRLLVEEKGYRDYLHEYIVDLKNHAYILGVLEEYDAAITVIEKAVEYARSLVVEEGLWEYARLYADALRVQAVIYHRWGRRYDALETYSDAEDIYRVLVYDEGDEDSMPGLAEVLLGKASIYYEMGKDEYAALFADEACELLEKLVYEKGRREYLESLSDAITITYMAYRRLGNKRALKEAIEKACRLIEYSRSLGVEPTDNIKSICTRSPSGASS